MPLPRSSALLLAAALLLTACGGDEPAAPPPGSDPTDTSAPAPTTPDEPAALPDDDDVTVTGNGIDLPDRLLEFGAAFDEARPVLEQALGPASLDTGVTGSFSVYGSCPGTQLRALEFADGALQVLFGDTGDGSDVLRMHTWALVEAGAPAEAPRALALVGDAATYEFGVGTSLPELQEGLAERLSVTEPQDPFPARFAVDDQSPGMSGALTSDGPEGEVTLVEGGSGCGE